MKLYEINEQIEALLNDVDPETGEINFDPAALDELMLAREEKLESIALAIKNIAADVNAIAQEIRTLTERKRVLENKAESIKGYLQNALAGSKFSTPKVAISYRNTKSVEINEAKFWDNPVPAQFIREKKEPDKTAIRDALENGVKIPGAEIVTKTSMTVK